MAARSCATESVIIWSAAATVSDLGAEVLRGDLDALLDWTPTHPTLVEDLDTGCYTA